jgi:signal transduction histidine kinase
MRLAALVLAALLAAAVWAGLAAQQQAPSAPFMRLEQAAFVTGDANPPDDSAALPWELRTLPDLWRIRGPADAGFGWYRAEFNVPQRPDTPWALHIPWANSALAVRLNGAELARETAFDAVSLPARASPPYLITLPASEIAQGYNILDIHLRVEKDINAGLSALEIGPQDAIIPRYLAGRFWRMDLPRALNMSGLVAALFMALLWLRRPGETLYPWFCALALVWAMRALYYTGDEAWMLPLRARLGLGSGDLFLASSLSLGFALLAIVVNRFAQRPQPALERFALVICVVLPLAIAPLGTQVLSPLQPAWYALAVAFAAYAAVTALQLARRARHWSHALIFAGIVFTMGTGLHDWLVVSGRLPYSPVPWLGYGPPVMLAAMVAALGGRYFHALDEAARLNRELEQRVADKTRELEQHYERISLLESAAAVAGERERLMRDMHDGVGSQLITLQHALEKGRFDNRQAADLVRECIDDLRLVIDSLDAGAQSMGDALANLRFRVEPRLAAAGIASTWDMQAPDMRLAPGVVLQLLRVLQEALTNALKHSGARNVHIAWLLDAQQSLATLRIEDDGRGLPIGAKPGGRGLANMRQRTQRVGAALQVSSSEHGTIVAAVLPVPGA